jgi:hypothetical protein
MSPAAAPSRSYTRVSEIPSWLATLSPQQLSELVERRLLGSPTGLPLPSRDEEPKDILEYAFRKADDNLRQKLRQALRGVVDRLAAAVLSTGTAVLEDRYDLLEGVCSLVAYTSCGEAWDSLSLLYNRLGDDNAKAVRTVILRCLSGLVHPPDSDALDVFGPMVEKFESLLADFDLCGLAFQAIFRYDTRRAARALPRLAATLLSRSSEDAPHSLARILSPMATLLPGSDQTRFLADALGAALKGGGKSSYALTDCLMKGMREMWGLAPKARNFIESFWWLRPSACSPVESRQLLGSVMVDPATSTYRGCEGATRLTRSEELTRKYRFSGPDIEDGWFVVVADPSTRYRDSLHKILKPETGVRVYQTRKSPNFYAGVSNRAWILQRLSNWAQLGPEQERELVYSGSKERARYATKLADKLP